MKNKKERSIFLADDDDDDCLFFQEVLHELPVTIDLTTVHDGEQLMKLLYDTVKLPHLLFLDLNMPRKNGFQCLTEIKQNDRLKQLKVVIFSTSDQPDIAEQLYNNGAQYFIHKPAAFADLKKVIHRIIMIMEQTLPEVNLIKGGITRQPARKDFVIA